MRYILLATKRLFRSLPFLILLTLLTLTVTASLFCDRAVSEPKAGIVSGGTGVHTNAVMTRLAELGFLPYATEQDLREDLKRGVITAGAVLSADIEQRILAADLENTVLFLYTPTAVLPDLFRLEIVTELLTEAAPYFSVSILEQLVPSKDLSEMISEKYKNELLYGTGFVFDIETISGKEVTEIGFSISLATASLSLFLFLVPLILACRLYDRSYIAMERRIGKRAALFTVFLPEALVTLLTELLLVALLVPLSAMISGQTAFADRLLPALLATLLLFSLGLVLPLVFHRSDTLQMLAVPVLLMTLALCPLFLDLALLFPPLHTLRLFLPTYWLFAATEAPKAFGFAALIALPLCSILFIAIKGHSNISKFKETP